ncbi:MAG: NAD(P)(+) transhydrogenase (Re/Si-specific) subunit alpha [Proteobacteria bacterium]|nr:NAD(P)(+) transhydrogenase (Re/Si-specific) subunit alpha [Pseudomonadota bacterium]
MRIGVPKETHPLEARVATTPNVVKKLIKKGFSVSVEKGAGARASFLDEEYEQAGADVLPDVKEIWDVADVILKVRPPGIREEGSQYAGEDECSWIKPEQKLITMIRPAINKELVERLKAQKSTAFALDCVPRITRAQKMDVLSSMANIAGYRAVIEAAEAYGGFFSGQMTAAGKSPPAKVLVIGAGVAGLAAIGAAKSMGAIVRAFDVRAAAGEQVKSMGAEFLTVEIEESGDGGGGYAKTMSKEFIAAEMALFREQAKDIDIVITTALIPGKKAPILWKEDMLETMKEGSVVVDLAAEMGGNCEGAVADEIVELHGVRILGFTDLPSRMPKVASEFFSMNLYHLLDELGGGEEWNQDLENEVIRGCIVLDEGELLWPPPRPKAPPAPPKKEEPAEPVKIEAKKEDSGSWRWMVGIALVVIFTMIGMSGQERFVQQFTVFALSCFIGWQVIWNVSHSLHTPLMSVTNAISGIIIVGGVLQLGHLGTENQLATILGAIAILVAAINIAGGFLVTQRMLAMFRRDD